MVSLAFAACGGTPSVPKDAEAPREDASADEQAPVPDEDASLSDAGGDTTDDRTLPDATAECGTERLRVVAGNLSGTGATYDDGRGARIFKGLSPDVALVQELRYGDDSAAAQRAFVDEAFGPTFAFVRGRLSNGSDIPNAVVSRFPILASGEWTDPEVGNRTFVWAQIDVPGPRDLYAVSVHLLTTNATARNLEAKALVAEIAKLPPGSLVVLGGDLNTTVRNETALGTFAGTLATDGPFPVDQAGNTNTNEPRSRPYDWVLAAPTLDACRTPVTIGAQTFPSGLVFDSRVYTPLEDVTPVRMSDSASPLQHMAIVRDFVLPR